MATAASSASQRETAAPTAHLRRRWLRGALVALLAAVACEALGAPPAPPADEVTITAYYGGNAKGTQERTIPFRAGDTAMTATVRALRVQTNAERTFIQSIEGLDNNKERKDYWLYFVNGEAMHVGAAETTLKPGDRVLWFLRRESSTKHGHQ